ncbi:lipoyltransferase [Pholiota conissans]|uniref:lipoyl(octanoyl) transferase n=1 Tax=Pholiota conissans TaxID=109636 RepID=A0A9P6CZU3_9AGAR|nr:lipoyltransferase [Pholiota conissans]
MPLPPILYHVFARPLPYTPTWNLQERIHQLQLQLRRSSEQPDVLLLLQHRPTYTSGRRQTEPDIHAERLRLENLGADFVTATRGGQLTYHGPGQIVGYPLIDLSRYSPIMGARDYVCRIQKLLQRHLHDAHGIEHAPSEHTGVFLDAQTKIASIGVQVRHRLTSHGFAINAAREPQTWFDRIVACGLDNVRAGSIESKLEKPVDVDSEILGLVGQFGNAFQRDMEKMNLEKAGEIGKAMLQLEKEAEAAGDWLKEPRKS